MTNKEYRQAFDFAMPYISIQQDKTDEPILFVQKDTPEDVRKKIEEAWPTVKAETLRRHNEGLYSSIDYFM